MIEPITLPAEGSGVGVLVGVEVGVAVGELVGVLVGVEVDVRVGDGVLVDVGVGVFVAVSVGVLDGVLVAVGVSVGPKVWPGPQPEEDKEMTNRHVERRAGSRERRTICMSLLRCHGRTRQQSHWQALVSSGNSLPPRTRNSSPRKLPHRATNR